MTKPTRIQRRRAKGWRMPCNTVCVDRTSKWGNPFIVSKHGNREYCVRLFTFLAGGLLCLSLDRECAIKQKNYPWKDIEELRGKNLACWCSLDKPCHADILLEIANKQEEAS